MLMKIKMFVCSSCHIPVKVRYVLNIHLVCSQLCIPSNFEPLCPLLADFYVIWSEHHCPSVNSYIYVSSIYF